MLRTGRPGGPRGTCGGQWSCGIRTGGDATAAVFLLTSLAVQARPAALVNCLACDAITAWPVFGFWVALQVRMAGWQPGQRASLRLGYIGRLRRSVWQRHKSFNCNS